MIEPPVDREALHETTSEMKLPEDPKPVDDLVCGGRSERKRKQHKEQQSCDHHEKVICPEDFKINLLSLS